MRAPKKRPNLPIGVAQAAVLALLLILGLGLPTPAVAGLAYSDPQTLTVWGAGYELRPRIAVDSSGRATVVWEGRGGIKVVQLAAADGSPGPAQIIKPSGGAWQLAIDRSDRVTVVWASNGIKVVQLSAADGSPGPVQTLLSEGCGRRCPRMDEPQVAVDDADRATIVWERKGLIESVRLAADGTPGPVQTVSDVGEHADTPQIAIDRSGRATIVWELFSRNGATRQIQAVRLTAEGTPGAVETLSKAHGEARDAQLAIDGSNRATIVWERFGLGRYGRARRIEAVRLTAGGTPGAVKTLSKSRKPEDAEPQLAVDASERATIVWEERHRRRTRIRAVRLSANGTPGPVRILSKAGRSAHAAQIAIDGSDRVTVVWHSCPFFGYCAIEGVRIAASGSPGKVQALSKDLRVEAEPGENLESNYDPQIAIDRSGRATVVWEGERGSKGHVQVVRSFTLQGSASAKKTQKQKGKKIVVKAKVTAGENLDAEGSGTVKVGKKSYKLKKQTKSVSSGSSKNLKLKLKKSKDAKKIAKYLKRGTKATAKLKVKLTDEAGNRETTKLKVKLKR